MIEQLSVKDYILFDQADIDFGRDMAVITGETGAGKSLLIDAIGYLCGGRATGDVVRKGAEKAVLTMVLSAPEGPVRTFLEENGFEPEDQLVITRTLSRTGKSSVRLNQQITTLAFIKKLTAMLIDIHSQMDTVTLMDPKVQLELLDQYADNEAEKAAVSAAYKNWSGAKKALDKAVNETFSDDELEFVTNRLNEIDEAKAGENELEELQERIKAAEKFSRIQEDTSECVYLLNRENGIMDSVYTLARTLRKMDGMEAWEEEVNGFYHAMDAMKEEMQDKLDALRQESQDLDAMQEREHFLRKLYRKYGGSHAAMMARRQEYEDKVDRILHRQNVLEKLETEVQETEARLKTANGALHASRKAVLHELEQAILSHARDLMLEQARFEILLQDSPYSAVGSDQVTFMASMNPGQPLTPIRQSASGGELSRLMLALKTVFQTGKGIDTIIFDEIDTGVSGKVALAMGQKMHLLARDRQVLCITHLASVAVHGDEHFKVSKSVEEGVTRTQVEELEGEAVLEELAVMASGQVTDNALEGMRELQEKVKHGQSALSH